MPLLTGANALDQAGYVITQLETIIERDIAAAPWLATFQPFGGVEAVHKQDDGLKLYGGKKPFYFLELGDLRISEETNTNGYTAWEMEISIEAVTNVSNSPIEEKLKAALISILNNAFAELITLGIEGSSIRGGQGRNQKPDRVNPHTFSCEVFTEL